MNYQIICFLIPLPADPSGFIEFLDFKWEPVIVPEGLLRVSFPWNLYPQQVEVRDRWHRWFDALRNEGFVAVQGSIMDGVCCIKAAKNDVLRPNR